MTVEEWEAEGLRRFGQDQLTWKFKCPVCKTVSSVKDYLEAKAPQGAIGFSCIGRFIPKEKSQRAFSDKKKKEGVPCDYSGSGLFQLNPIEIDGKDLRFFEFA